MIYVIATIEVKPGKRDAFLAEFHRNVPNVLAEKGCIEYGPTVDVKTEIKAQIPRSLRAEKVVLAYRIGGEGELVAVPRLGKGPRAGQEALAKNLNGEGTDTEEQDSRGSSTHVVAAAHHREEPEHEPGEDEDHDQALDGVALGGMLAHGSPFGSSG